MILEVERDENDVVFKHISEDDLNRIYNRLNNLAYCLRHINSFSKQHWLTLSFDDCCIECGFDPQTIRSVLKENIDKKEYDYIPLKAIIDDPKIPVLSTRAYNCLCRGISPVFTLKQLMDMSDDEIKEIRNCGKKTFIEIQNFRNKIRERFPDLLLN